MVRKVAIYLQKCWRKCFRAWSHGEDEDGEKKMLMFKMVAMVIKDGHGGNKFDDNDDDIVDDSDVDDDGDDDANDDDNDDDDDDDNENDDIEEDYG